MLVTEGIALLKKVGKVAALGTALLLTACGTAESSPSDTGRRTLHFTGPTFQDLRTLRAASDLVIVGHPDRVIGRELDGGGGPEVAADGRARGVPLVFYSVAVDRVIAGSAPRSQIVVSWMDTEAADNDYQATPLSEGQQVVLFLDFVASEQSPGIQLVGDHYVSVGGDAGAFDVSGSSVTARSPSIRSRTPSAQPEPGMERVTFQMQDFD
jgi:hypothetical protein